jgi:hypothetical protein
MNNFMLFKEDDKKKVWMKEGIGYDENKVAKHPNFFVYNKIQKKNEEEKDVIKIVSSSENKNVLFCFKDFIKSLPDHGKNVEWNRAILNSQNIIDGRGMNEKDCKIVLSNVVYTNQCGMNYLKNEEVRYIDGGTSMYKDFKRFFEFIRLLNDMQDGYKGNEKRFSFVGIKKYNSIIKNKDVQKKLGLNIEIFDEKCNDYFNALYYKWCDKDNIDLDEEYNQVKKDIRNIFEKFMRLDLPYNRGYKFRIIYEMKDENGICACSEKQEKLN